jgi:hypothetical protein
MVSSPYFGRLYSLSEGRAKRMNIRFRDSEPDAPSLPTLMQAIPAVSKDYVLSGKLLHRYRKYKTDERSELAYVLRRVELNHRLLTEGQSPWSIRQTAVYHKFAVTPDSKQSSSTFILIAPSPKLESQLSQSLDLSKSDERAIGPWNVHRLLVANSMSGWMDYMAWLEETLNEQARSTSRDEKGTF